MNRNLKRRWMDAVGVILATSLPLGALAQTEDINESMGGITAYQLRTDDCLLSACGYIAPELKDDLESLSDLRNMGSFHIDDNFIGATSPEQNEEQFLNSFDDFVQTVYLNFDAVPETSIVSDFRGIPVVEFPSYQFNQEERDAIQERLEADYKRFPTIRFTQNQPSDGRSYTTLTFACENGDPTASCIYYDPFSGGISILFGRAENIDFLNGQTDDNAFIDVQFASFVVYLGAFGFFNNTMGVPVDGNDPESVAQALSTASINQAANTAAHELGHILGLRHHDSFGAPGDGLPTTGRPVPDLFIPVYPGEQNASETVDHIMASGASAGINLAASFAEDRFFSERSATKLLATRFVPRQKESFVERPWNPSRNIYFSRFLVPNTIVEGENEGSLLLDVKGALITEAFVDTSAVDVYKFSGKAGQYVSAEVVSFTDSEVADPVITNLALYEVNEDETRTLIGYNMQPFESFDPLLLDIPLTNDGEYELVVEAATYVIFGGMVYPLIGEDEVFTHGYYKLIAYQVDGPLNLHKHNLHQYKSY